MPGPTRGNSAPIYRNKPSPIPPVRRHPPVYELGFVAPMLFCDGYGVAAQNMMLGLDNLGVRINFFKGKYYFEEGLKPRAVQIIRESTGCKADNRLLFYTPWDYAPESGHLGRRNIGFTMFETTQIPKDWDILVNRNVERLFVPCDDNVRLFKRCGVRVPVEKVPLGIDPGEWPYTSKRPRKQFVFLIQGLLDKRKGADIAINAFKMAFPANQKDVKLLIKTRDRVFDCRVNLDDRMHMIDKRLTHEQMLELYSVTDCFIFPTRGEGYGQPPLEALATGIPIIVTNAGATGEWFDKRFMYPIEVNGYVPCDYYSEAWGNIGEWLDPRVESCAEQMKYVYEHQEEALKKGKEGSEWVKKEHDIAIGARILKEKLENVGFFG